MMGSAWSTIRRWFGYLDNRDNPEVTSLDKSSIPQGSLIYMQKQDPSVRGIGSRLVWVSTKMSPGPRSSDIKINIGKTVYASDRANNFLYNREDCYQEYSAVSLFGVVNHVLMMYRRGLKRMGSSVRVKWNWGSSPIQVHARAGEMINAEYAREERSLFFYYYNNDIGQRIYTCESFDVVAHEVGHAILDGLKPRYIESRSPQTGALHESFGDITVILALLEQLDMCEAVIAYSKCDLHSDTFFNEVAEQLGMALGSKMGLRNADNNFKIDQVTEEIHDLSRVFTGAFFDVLVELFESQVRLEKYVPAETLYKVGRHMCAVTVVGFLNGPQRDAQFRDIAKAMMDAEPNPTYKAIYKKHFDARKIFDPSAKPKPYVSPESCGKPGMCGTLDYVHDPDFRKERQATFEFMDFNDDDDKDADEDDDIHGDEEGRERMHQEEVSEAHGVEDVEDTPLLDKKDI